MDPEGRHYTSAELDALELNLGQMPPPPASPAQGHSISTAPPPPKTGVAMQKGFNVALDRTLLGLKQAYKYMSGDDAGREAINEEIQRLEEENAQYLETGAGKIGEAVGVATQFAGPQAVGLGAAKVLPQAIVRGTRAMTGAPQSVGRAATQGAGFEAAQPVDVPDASTGELMQGKLGRTMVGGGGGAAVGKIAKTITSPGPVISPERGGIVKEAERLGVKLTPAQRTGDVTLSQYEEGLASRPGSAKTIIDAREAQQAVLNKRAAAAIGQSGAAPNEAVLAAAREAAAKGYEPLAGVEKMAWDSQYMTELENFVKGQATKVTGSTDAAAIAKKLAKHNKKWTGGRFLEDLQNIRDMSFAARGKNDINTAKELSELAEIMEDFAERRVEKLAKMGKVAPDAVESMRKARTEYAKIHAIEKATEPVSGRVSALKYLTGEFKRRPASKGPGTSEVDTGLRDVGATARVLKQVTPYIGSSGTAERIAGQQLVEATQGPMAAWRAAGPMLKNYLAAKYYMAHGGKPGLFGSRLTPTQNMYVRRLLPGVGVGSGEAATE